MNNTTCFSVRGLRTMICLLLVVGFSYQVIGETKTDVNALLTQIKTYDYGQNRETLSQLSDLVRAAYGKPADLQAIEQGFIEFLKTDATFAAKQFVCKELSVFGTEASVPVLSELLKADKTADIALYALERIPGVEVDQTLRKALPKAKGKVKVGIINTIGQRGDKAAVKEIGKLVTDKELLVGEAAAAALGKIGCPKAVEALASAKTKTSGKVLTTVLDAYLLAADQMAANGETAKAAAIYKELFVAEQPQPIQAAALRGLVKTSGENGGTIILDVLQKGDSPVQPVAIDLVRELPKSTDLQAIAGTLVKLSEAGKVQLLAAFADRGDVSVRPTAITATKEESEEVRIAAIKAVKVLGNAEDVQLLAGIAAATKGPEQEAAREALDRLRGADIDPKIIQLIPQTAADVKVELIRSVGARMTPNAEPTLLTVATDEDRKVRVETYKSLGIVADPQYVTQTIDLLVSVQNDGERKAAERAVVSISRRVTDQQNQAAAVLAKLQAVTEVNARSSLLQVAGRIGDKNALPVLRKALTDKNADIKVAAIQALSEWPTPEPMPDLLTIAQKSKDEVQQVLGLRGYIQLNGLESERPAGEILKNYEIALKLAKNANEKRMVLSGLSNLSQVAALELAAQCLGQADVQQEAETAVVKIAWQARDENPEKVKGLVKQVLDSTQDERTKRNAQRLVDQMEKK